ncbi:MAG: glycoside hydrolase family 127 protein, partial [archaeon]|nr:glycoside hydrolase family 127 protein [archaeon]
KIIAEQKDDFREGYFFADSDAYKWLDAASRIYYNYPSEKLLGKINEFIELIEKTQMEDGYIYTYNQVHFPTKRWINLQIEHELYCLGHLIEAGISHFKATGQEKLLRIVEKVANLIIKDFINSDPKGTPGHQEIELALIKLFRVTDNKEYLEMAKLFVERRGKIKYHGSHMFKTIRSVGKRTINISKLKKKYIEEHPEHAQFKIQESSRLTHISPIISFWFILRFINSWRSGKYSQQHKPIREQKVPVGHSVRFSYLETAIAMLYRETFDSSFLKHLEEIWVHMVKKKMYVTGGIGSVPAIEGFGRDYDLHPEHAYCETCAALGSILWNWEMVLITKEAKYSDLLEWQLYNAALVGVSLDGKSYLYHNPLTEKHGLMREVWFDCPCCPSNVSRIYASIGKYIYSHTENEIWIHQYINNSTIIDVDNPIEIDMKSEFPWNGTVLLKINSEKSSKFTINLRVPGWVDDYSIKVNGSLQIQNMPAVIKTMDEDRTASGYSPFKSHFIRLTREWT